jgi:hypothetical protein
MWVRRVIPGLGFALLGAALPLQAVHSQTYTAAAAPRSAVVAKRARARLLNDAVQVVAPAGPVLLAHEFEIKLEGETETLSRITVTQWTEADGHPKEVYQGFQSGPGERRGDALVLKVAPYQLGKVQLRLSGTGKAGGQVEVLHKDVWVEVAAPTAALVDLRFARKSAWDESREGVPTMRVGLRETDLPLQLDLGLEAVYRGVLEAQPVKAAEVQYRVRTGAQAVALDPRTGIVRGLQSGRALVEASYGGLTKLACVVVGEDAGEAQCGDLLER